MIENVSLAFLQSKIAKQQLEIEALHQVIEIGAKRFDNMRHLFNLCIDWNALPDCGKIMLKEELMICRDTK